MKQRITFEFSDEERLVLGIRSTGVLHPATRAQAEEVVQGLVHGALSKGVKALEGLQDEIISKIGV